MLEETDNSGDQGDSLPEMTDDNRRFLLGVAHEAVERLVKGRQQAKLLYDDPVLKQKWGAFVTLRVKGDLRGCIGSIVSDMPMPETIADMAVKSASQDSRFDPIGPAELKDIHIDISILGPLSEVRDISEIVIGRHGLVVEYRGRRGLLLPQVATEHNMDVPGFVAQTCLKAGLPPDSWKHGAKIYKFAADVF